MADRVLLKILKYAKRHGGRPIDAEYFEDADVAEALVKEGIAEITKLKGHPRAKPEKPPEPAKPKVSSADKLKEQHAENMKKYRVEIEMKREASGA